MKKLYETGSELLVTIEACHGNLIVRGWNEAQVKLRGDDFTAEESEKGLVISSSGSLTVKMPAQGQLIVRHAHGDVIVKGITSHALLEEISGDLVLSRMGATDVQRVRADVAAKRIDGPLQVSEVTGDLAVSRSGALTVSRVHGDLAARQVEKGITIEEVSGDVALRAVEGDVTVQRVHGDAAVNTVSGLVSLPQVTGTIRLTGPLGSGKHNLKADGNIVVSWPIELPVTIAAEAGRITNRLALDEEESSEGMLHGRLGETEPDITLVLNAGKRIVLKEKDIVNKSWVHGELGEGGFNFDFDFSGIENLGEQLRSNFQTQMAQFEKQFGADFAAKLGSKLERAAERAEAAAERAQKQAERAAKRQARRQRRGFTAPPRAAKKPDPPTQASTEEQMRVLKMLEKGVISADEAQTLLDALG